MMAKGMKSSVPPPPKGRFMGGGAMPPQSSPDDEEDEHDQMGGKLLGLQNLIGAIASISDDDIRPYVEKLKSQVHGAHEAAEGDDLGMKEHEDEMEGSEGDMGMSPKKGALDVSIGVGIPKPGKGMGSPVSEEEEEDEDEDTPKGGILAILAKKVKKPK